MAQYLDTVDSNWFRQRLNGIIFIALAAFVLLIVRLFYLQAIEGEEYRRLSENNSIRLQSIDPPRGLIFDRDGELLVDNRPSFDLSVVLKDANPLEHTIEKLAYYIKDPLPDLMEKVAKEKSKSSYQPIMLKQDIGRNALAAIEVHKFDLPGALVEVKTRRHYINSFSGAHLIGYLGEINAGELKRGKYPGYRRGDFVGRFGVEKTFEKYLRGKRGGAQVEVNANGQVVRVMSTVSAQAGHNIYLTIDQDLQEKTETLLKGHAGAAIAMDPSNGKILALVSSPSYDQNAFVSGLSHEQWNALVSNPFRPLQNKAVQGEYPPASVYKIITASAALEDKVIDEQTTFYCPGHYRFGDRVFKCWKKGGHGKVNVIKALSESCDVYFYQVGQKLGIDRLAWYARESGLGVATGIELDQESNGLVPTARWKERRTGIPWQKGETLSIAIGQGYNLVTPLQMAVLTSAVANGGIRYRPLILNKIESAQGKIITGSEPGEIGKLPVSEETLKLVKKGLWEVVNSNTGTARKARIKGIEVSGKTGTAQVVGRADDETEEDEENRAFHLKPHAWFVAYAPSDAPRIAVSVIVEHGEKGSSKAAPIAKNMIELYLLKNKFHKKSVARRSLSD